MKSKLVVSLLVVVTMLCPAFAFAAEEKGPVAVDETVVVAEDTATGNVVGEAVEVDELYAPANAKDIKAEAKADIKEVKETAAEETAEIKAEEKEAVKDIKAEEKEALKETKM
jgi:hypothetical protein